MKVFAISPDFDGCLFSPTFFSKRAEIETKFNQKLQQELQEILVRYQGDHKETLNDLLNKNLRNLTEYARDHRKLEKAPFGYLPSTVLHAAALVHADQIFIDKATAICEVFIKHIVKNYEERQKEIDEQFILCNEGFIQHVLSKIAEHHYEKVILLVGSSRQSKQIDSGNSYFFGSCYPYLNILRDAIQSRTSTPCVVDPYLLSDAYGSRPEGENFNKAIEEDQLYAFSDFCWDYDKVTIVYSQAHKVATDHLHDKVDFDFIDDKKGILAGPCWFFSDNKKLLPSNVNLKLYQYAGQTVTLYDAKYLCEDKPREAMIQGSGVVDECYSENIKFMAKCLGYDSNYYPSDVDFSIGSRLTGESLVKFKAERKLSLANVMQELANEINQFSSDPIDFYKAEELRSLRSTLDILFGEINNDVTAQQSCQRAEEDILKSPSVIVARETIRLLTWLREKNIFVSSFGDSFIINDRKTALISYSTQCGEQSNVLNYTLNSIWSNIHFLSVLNTSFTTSAWSIMSKLLQPFASLNNFFSRHINHGLFATTSLGTQVRRVNGEISKIMELDEIQLRRR